MRHLKSDVSHRMRRRPSIFTARWFRVTLGVGVVVVLALWLGPPVAGWLRGRPAPPPATRAPEASPTPSRPAESTVAVALPRAEPKPVPAASVPPVASAPPVTTSPPAASPPLVPRAAAGSPATPAPPAENGATTADAPPSRPAPAPPATADGAVYRIQVGAFLDHRNADRLTERLRGQGADVVTTVVEESRTMYRVVATPSEALGVDALIERLRKLGHSAELTDGGAVVTRPVPLRSAIETSRQLREQGIRVRLESGASSAAFRVVRVGAYPSAEEAERARAELGARGYEGFVVRER
jgi:cell division septation protein DedD